MLSYLKFLWDEVLESRPLFAFFWRFPNYYLYPHLGGSEPMIHSKKGKQNIDDKYCISRELRPWTYIGLSMQLALP